MELIYFIPIAIICIIAGYFMGHKQPKVTASDILSAYLEQELSLLVQKLQQVKPADMEVKQEILQLLQAKIQQARSLHNRLLTGTFESVHSKALSHVAFLTWDIDNET